ncbi:MAG: TolC family protein [Desulfosoma sp.]
MPAPAPSLAATGAARPKRGAARAALVPGEKPFRLKRRVFPAAAFWVMAFMAFSPSLSRALTLEQALSEALATHPQVKAAEEDLRARKALERSSLSPYAPSLDLTGSVDRISRGSIDDRRDQSSLGAEYLLFDGGARFSDRSAARIQLARAQEALRAARLDVIRDVSVAFFLVLARTRIVAERTLQVEDARKDLEIAEGRYRLGVAMKSDVLQASVRYEEALFEKNSAEGDLSTAQATLRSLVGRPLDSAHEAEGSLEILGSLKDRERLLALAEERPEVLQARMDAALAEAQLQKTRSPFLPKVTADAAYTTNDGTGYFGDINDEKRVGVTASWNLFRLDKFYNRKAAMAQLQAAKDRLAEAVRQARLECFNRYDRALTARRNVDLARSVLVQAEHNYRQALGEYRVGKGDVLSLVRAESALGAARVRLQESLGNWNVTLAELQRAAGLERLDELLKTE